MKLSELKKYIEENIVEILDEAGTYGGKKAIDDMKKDADYNTLSGQTKIDAEKKLQAGGSFTVGEAKNQDEDEEIEDTYGKEDEDDKKDAKIKATKPSKSDLKKNASIATITDALAKVTVEFKEITEKYKKAEGGEKAKFLAKLKDLTPKIQTLKKALEKKEEALK